MSKVVDIRSKQPHMTGHALCLNCGYKWIAVSEIGVTSLDCKECGLSKGVYNYICCPETYFQCDCGCTHFFISGTGNMICCFCGTAANLGE